MYWDDDLENATYCDPPMDPESQTWTDYFLEVPDEALCVADHIEWTVLLETSDRVKALTTMKEQLDTHPRMRLRKRERSRREAATWFGFCCSIRQREDWETVASSGLDEL